MSLRRLLIRLNDKFGDFLVITPLLAGLRARFTALHITMLVKAKPGAWLTGHPLVSDILWEDRAGKYSGIRGMNRLQREIRSRCFDAVITPYGGLRYAWMFWRAGIPIRIGRSSSRLRGALMTHIVPPTASTPGEHEVEHSYELGRPLGLTGRPGPQIFPISAEDEAAAVRLLRAGGIAGTDRLVVINPTYGGSSRAWRAERFADVGRAVAAQPGTQVILIGTAADADHNAVVARAIGPRCLNLTGKTTPSVLGAVLRQCAVHVSIDTGTCHLAAAMGTPCVTLFPFFEHWDIRARWHPWRAEARLVGPRQRCKSCRPGRCTRTEDVCIDSLSSEAVIEAVLELLDRASGQRASA